MCQGLILLGNSKQDYGPVLLPYSIFYPIYANLKSKQLSTHLY